MEGIIEFRQYPLDMILDKLLIDKTTGKRIIWATDGYSEYGDKYCDRFEITPGALAGINPVLIQPRAFKALETQQQRTKSKAEVFTPSWIVNKMVNHLDEEWFGCPDVFNIEKDQTWETKTEKIDFKSKKWKDYVDRPVLEITCGEAPFIVSRYNASTGQIIPVEERIGILDRKLRVVTENTDNEEDWIKWATRAYESVYGYEYQGDNLLIGRINLLMTFVDYYQSVWNKEADKDLLTAITNIITWNFWQMDGLNGTVPLGVPQPVFEQMTLFDIEDKTEEKAPLCKVRKWRARKTIRYKEIETKEGKDMGKKKWDIVIGNPPYQEETTEKVGNNRQKPSKSIFQMFQQAADEISEDLSVLIYPGKRWMHRSGKGMKEFGLAQINDPHLAQIDFYPKAQEIFPETGINDGITIVTKNYRKKEGGFRYNYIIDNSKTSRILGNPGDDLIVLNPEDIDIAQSISATVNSLGLTYLHDRILPRSLFNLESDVVEKNPGKFTLFEKAKNYNPDTMVKAYVNDQSGSKGRTKLFVTDKSHISSHPELINQWQVVAISANPGGQRRDNQLQIIDNNTVFGRAKVGFGTFQTEEEAKNFFNYCKSYLVKYSLLLTDENLTSLAKKVPDLDDYSSNNKLVDFSQPLDEQLFKLFGISEEQEKYIQNLIDNREKGRK